MSFVHLLAVRCQDGCLKAAKRLIVAADADAWQDPSVLNGELANGLSMNWAGCGCGQLEGLTRYSSCAAPCNIDTGCCLNPPVISGFSHLNHQWARSYLRSQLAAENSEAASPCSCQQLLVPWPRSADPVQSDGQLRVAI